MELVEKINIEESEAIPARPYYGFFKRVFDLCFALLLLPILLPIMAVIAVLIKLNSKGPVFFAHERIGKNGNSFPCYKFRTMVQNAEEKLKEVLKNPEARAEWKKDHKLKNDPRITRIGAILRKTSLDELPQLFNVFQGNMSFVGPRPIVKEEVIKYGNDFDYYQSVLPGITGFWQISGRNDVDYKQRTLLDKEYALKKSLSFDVMLLLKTIPAVLKKKGAY